jgi:hypothetical protein
MITVGSEVRLRSCPDSGTPGTAMRLERDRWTVYWPDLAFTGRHPESSLMEAELSDEADVGAPDG